ncbi:hypothetical protein ACI3L3_10095 [Desulfobaculum sp. SPO524]|uniref:hypothetical protein n=1 Tax=Desulfobaculum sp. SPO524 TaxID=3378071 RepID=UPI003853B74F
MADRKLALPALPAIPASAAPDVRAWMEAVAAVVNTLTGTLPNAERNRALLVRDLATIGVQPSAFVRATGAMFDFARQATDDTVPNPPRDFSVQNQILVNRLSWTNPTDPNLWFVEVWRSETASRDDAARVGIATAPVAVFRDTGISTQKDYWYWIRAVTWSGRYSVWTPSDAQGGYVVPASFPETINKALATLADDTRYETVHKVVADSFMVLQPEAGVAEPKAVFVVGDIDGEPSVGIAGDMFVDGTIVSRMLEAGTLTGGEISALAAIRLAEGGFLHVGAGNLHLTSGNAGNNHGKILCGPDGAINEDGSVNEGFDFAVFDAGDLFFYRWRDGQHRLFKSVKNVEHLTAVPNNQWADLGYFLAEPRVMVSPANLQCYDGAYGNQNQFFHLGFEKRRKAGLTDFWEVRPVAQLTLDPAGGNQSVGLSSSSTSDGVTFSSGTARTPANCDQVTVHVRLKSVTPTGTSNTFYAKRIQWRVVVDGSPRAWRTVTIGPSLDYVSDAATEGLTAGEHDIRVDARGELAGGTFTVSEPEKDWTTRTAQVSPGTALSLNGSSANGPTSTSAGVSMPSVNTAGWNVHSVDYTWTFSGQVDVTQATVDGGGASVIAEVRLSGVGQWYTTFGGGSTSVSRSENDGAGSVLSSSSFELAFTSLSNCAASASLTLTSVSVSVSMWRYATNPSQTTNDIQFDSFDFHLASATVLASGDVNIIAIGD